MTHHQWLLFLPAAALVAASPGAGNSGHPMARQFATLSAAYMMIDVAGASGYALASSRIKALRLGRQGARRAVR